MNIIRKVGAFVVRRPTGDGPAELLLFTHVDSPDVSIQIPGGGIEPGEKPVMAALRELREEAGIGPLPVIRALGMSEMTSMVQPGAVVRRHCFLFDGAGLPDHWIHTVTGQGEDCALRFEYRWHRIATNFALWRDLNFFLTPKHIPELYAPVTRSHSPTATIRSATPADAPHIARIHVETWRSAYHDIIPAAFLENLSVEKRTVGWEKNLRENRDSVLIAEINGQVVGWISFGPCRDEGTDEAHHAEIYAIYLDPARQRKGIGRALMREAERSLVSRLPGATRISLWVLACNECTRRFYERIGYSAGPREKTELIGGEPFTELRYEKPLPPAPDSHADPTSLHPDLPTGFLKTRS